MNHVKKEKEKKKAILMVSTKLFFLFTPQPIKKSFAKQKPKRTTFPGTRKAKSSACTEYANFRLLLLKPSQLGG